MAPRPDKLFRYAGLAASLVIGTYAYAEVISAGALGMLASGAAPDRARAEILFRLVLVAEPALVLLFAGLFWWVTSEGHLRRSSGASIVLLLAQTVVGLSLPQESLIIVAGAAGYVLRGKAAVGWIVFQSAAEIALVVASILTGDCVPLEGIPHVPKDLACGLTGAAALTWLLFAYFAGYMAAAEGRERRALARANAELRATQGLLADSSRVAERVRIARELHDSIGHHLTGLSLHLQLASRLAQGEAAAPVQKAHIMSKLMLNDVRDALGALQAERSLDLQRALKELCAGVPYPRVHLSIADGLEIRDPASAHVLFRCAQEVLTNAIRHSGARNLWLSLEATESGVALMAKDDGRGVPAVKAGNGLRGMRERVEESGGQLTIESGAGNGFHVAVLLPQTEERA
jgi:signal transduction histidine kinase